MLKTRDNSIVLGTQAVSGEIALNDIGSNSTMVAATEKNILWSLAFSVSSQNCQLEIILVYVPVECLGAKM